MTDMMDRMEDEGLAERVRDKNDRRLVKVRLTDKGKKTRQEFYKKRRKEFESVFHQLAPEDVHKFVKNLSEATEILKKIN
jgi:DNA-binding MarR family transcriptional regulator